MFDQEALIRQVLQNCSISDSRHAGLYSICGLAMRLRDLYKWEKGLDPWVEKDSAQIIEWIGAKEEEWDGLEEKDFHPISIAGEDRDPFDVSGINAVVEPEGLLYGAGYIHNMKPTFFLAHLEEKRKINGHWVYILGHELARDLFTIPALSQENSILIRTESGRLFFWDQIFFIKKSGQLAMDYALNAYGVKTRDPKSLRQHLTRIFRSEMDRYLYHELGEIEDRVFDRLAWQEIIAAFPHTPIELLIRTVKDLLADTNDHGTLRHIIKERKKGTLAFYVAFHDGLAKEMFPEIKDAFLDFIKVEDWSEIEKAVSMGFRRAKETAGTIKEIYRRGKQNQSLERVEREMAKRLLEPLGIMKRVDGRNKGA